MKTSIFRWRYGVGIAGLCLCALLLYVMFTARIPADSPMARMYRTEADMALLRKAILVYYDTYEVYPPGGEHGLSIAMELFTNVDRFLPEGLPADGWEEAFVYVPHSEYGMPESSALLVNDGFEAPESFQLFSRGADGKAGASASSEREDNIVSWEKSKNWRPTYKKLQRTFQSGK